MSSGPLAVAPEPSDRPVTLLCVATVSRMIRHFLRPYAEHLRSQGWRVDAAASGAATDTALQSAFDDVFEIPLSRSILDLPGLVRGERAIAGILALQPDIVHVHSPIAAFVTRYAVRRMSRDHRPAVAYTAHGFHFHEGGPRLGNLLYLTAERIAGRWTDRLVVMNSEDEAAALRHRIVPASRLVRMPGIGIDTARYSPDAVPPSVVAGLRDQIGISVNSPVFVVVAELRGRKRQRDVLAALAAMRSPDAHLVLAGSGPDQASLEAQTQALGIAGRVHFLGMIDDVRPVVRAATALILASDREGLARSVMEALALGVPAIVSTARGNEELVDDGSGIVFPIGDTASLTRAMDWMIEHPDERAMMGIRGRERMIEGYDLPLVMQMHEVMYREMLAERAGREA